MRPEIEMACADDERNTRPGLNPALHHRWMPVLGAVTYRRITARRSRERLPLLASVMLILIASIALWAALVVMLIALFGRGS